MRAPKLPTFGKKVLDISTFSGEHRGVLSDGQLVDSDGVTVLSGGALCSLLKARKLDIMHNVTLLSEGAYSLCTEHDCDYETYVTPEWVYQNICPKDILAYETWQLPGSRILVKSTGEEGKSENGYRRVLGAFDDGDKIFVFYEACYIIVDERRSATHTKLDKGYVMYFNAGLSGDLNGSVTVYSLSQLLLDVIDADGLISTSLVDARIVQRKKITESKYKKSTLASTDGVTYRYLSSDYLPSLGGSYTVNYDRVYTEIYPTLAEDYASVYFGYLGPKRAVRYSNMTDGEEPFGTIGEKLMLLPDMHLLSQSDGMWALSDEKADTPTLYAAVQYFDRLFGIGGDTVYASHAGACTNFSESLDETVLGSWRMVTADEGGFTAITSFGGKVVVFTAASMMTVRGSEKPFNLSFVGEHGCVSQDALTTLDGLLYFVSREGVMCYNGSSVKKISAPLPRSADYTMATLTAADGILVLSVLDGGFWIYEPQSGQWSRIKADVSDALFVGETAILRSSGGSVPYRFFDEFGDFSFAISLVNGGRRRIKSISVTAQVGIDSELALLDENGDVQMCIYDTDDEIVTRTFLPCAFYLDHGKIRFEGMGDCTLYALRIEYASLPFSSKRKG